MVKNKFFLIGLLLVAIVVVYTVVLDNGTSSLDQTIDPAVYKQQLAEERKKKDGFFKTGSESPIINKASFKGLLYFAPDPAYRVVAKLEPFADKTQKLVVRMSDGSEDVYDKYAHAVFNLQGETCRLLVVKLDNTYSILFRDATSGKETYGGGRYIELDPANLSANQAVLDFNTAYNPYCAYAPGYACPLPPAENTIKVAVKAGEKYIPHEAE